MERIQTSNKSKWFFIVNITAGRGKAGRQVRKLIKLLKKHKFNYELEVTKFPKHAIELAMDAIERGFRRVVAVGGDGTINEVMTGIYLSGKSSEVLMGFISKGGGNDFARHFDFSSKMEKEIIRLRKQKTVAVDIGKVEDFYFINSMGVGFDGQVTQLAWKIGTFNNILCYLLAYLVAIIKLKSYHIKLKINGDEIENEFLLVGVGNGKFVGRGVKRAPNAEVNDGLFDICMIEKVTRRRLLRLIPEAYRGNLLRFPEVNLQNSTTILVSSEKELPVYYDGEIPELKNPREFKVEIIPQAINLIC